MCLWGSSTPIFHTQPSYTQTSLPLSLSFSFSLDLRHTHTFFKHRQPYLKYTLSLCISQTLTAFRHPFLMYSLSLSDSHTFQTSIPYVLSVSVRLSHLSDIHLLCTLCLSQTLTPFRHPFLMYYLSLSDSHTFQTQNPFLIYSLYLCLSQTLTPFRHRIHSLCTLFISVSLRHTSFTRRHPFLMYF